MSRRLATETPGSAPPANRRRPGGRLAAVGGICGALVSGARSSPANEFTRHALALGMHREVVAGEEFQHVVLSRDPRPSRTLHVYVDGEIVGDIKPV